MMKRNSGLSLVGGIAVAVSLLMFLGLSGCSRDPNAKKQKYLESGKRYMQQQKYKEGAIQFQNAIQVDPRFAAARYELAHAYLKMNLWAAAYAELSRTIEIEPNNIQARLDMGNLLLSANQLAQASEQTDFILTKQPNNPEAHVLVANIASRKGDTKAAVDELELATRLAPQRADFYYSLAEVQFRLKQYDGAEANLRKALSLDPKLAPALVSLAAVYQQENRKDDAEKILLQSVQVDPKDIRSRMALVRFYFMSGSPDKGEQAMVQAAKDLPDNSEAYRLPADFYWSRGEHARALAEYEKLHNAHPADHAVLANYVKLLMVNDRFPDAEKLITEMLKKNDKDTDALVARATVLNHNGDARSASDILQNVLKAEPDNANAHFQLGTSFEILGDVPRAESEYREAARLYPTLYDAQQAIARTALRQGKADALADSSQRMIDLQPTNPFGYLLRSAASIARKQYAPAEADLQRAMQLAPDSPLPYARMGELRLIQHKVPEAEKLFQQALQKQPDSLEALEGLVTIYGGVQKNLPKATALVETQLAKAPQSSMLYAVLADLQLANKEPDKAEASLNKSVELNKNNVESIIALARFYNDHGQAERALPLFERAITIKPNDDRAYVYLGNGYLAKKDYPKAEQYYRKLLLLRPDSPEASNNLAYALLEQGKDIDYALSLAQVAHRAYPDSPGAADTLGWAYYQKGAYGLAIDLLERANKQDPTLADIQYHLGLAYDKNSDPEKAKLHLKKAMELDPKNDARNAEIRKALDTMGKQPAAPKRG